MRYFTGLVIWFLGFVFFAAPVGAVYRDEEKISRVLSGELTVARAVWWGFDPDDSTGAIQEAIDSGAKKLLVENVGADWTIGPIEVASNIEIIFENGVVVRAKRGEFQKSTDSLFRIRGRENVTLRGEGDVVFVMHKLDYMNPELYRVGESRHGIFIFGSQNVRIKNLTVRETGGDGIYVGCSPRTPVAKNIVIDKVVSEDNLRQGLSVTGVKDMLVRDSVFKNTKGVLPESGIDLEPNFPECSIVNFVAENCAFEGNAHSGVLVQLMKLDETSEPPSITFRNCRMRGNAYGITIANTGRGTPELPGRIEFIDCEISKTKIFPVLIQRQMVENLDLVFKDIVIDNREPGRREAVRMSSPEAEGIYGLKIEGLKVKDDRGLPIIEYVESYGRGLVAPVIKDVKTVRSDGSVVVFDVEKFVKEHEATPMALEFETPELDIRSLKPVSDRGAAAGIDIRYRHTIEFLQYAEMGQNIDIKFIHRPLPAYTRRTRIPVIVTCPRGSVFDRFLIPYDEMLEYTLEAKDTGVYTFSVNTGFQTVSIESGAPGQGVSAADRLPLLVCSGELYFHVPIGVKDIRIGAAAATREPATVHLLRPDGKKMDSRIDMESGTILSHTRRDASRDEVWSIRFRADKLFLRMGAPLVPVFSSAPENLLVMEAE